MTSASELPTRLRQQVHQFLLDSLNPDSELKCDIMHTWGQAEKDYMLSLCKDKRIFPLLYKRLKSKPQADGYIVDKLGSMHRNNAGRNLKLFSELRQILNAFHKAGIEVILLKGSYLAPVVYGDIANRVLRDIDLLIRMEEMIRVLEVMKSLGYTQRENYACCQGSPQKLMEFLAGRKHLHPFFKGDIAVEIHATIAGPTDPQINIDDFWQRSQTIQMMGCPARVFSPEDFLLHLCLHATFQDIFTNGLLTVQDIRFFMTKVASRINLNEMLARARQLHMENAVDMTMLLTRRLAGLDSCGSFFKDARFGNEGELELVAMEQMFTGKVSRSYSDFSASTPIQRIKLVFSRWFVSRHALEYQYGNLNNVFQVIKAYGMRFRYLLSSHAAGLRSVTSRDSMLHQTSEQQGKIRDWLKEK